MENFNYLTELITQRWFRSYQIKKRWVYSKVPFMYTHILPLPPCMGATTWGQEFLLSSQDWWYTSVIPITEEADIGES
jgi:hypothetical protein